LEKGTSYTFSNNQSPILVGRSEIGVNVRLKGKQVSRYQFTLSYKDKNWSISDGNSKHPSSNGTFIYPKEEVKIGDNIEVRYGDFTLIGKLHISKS